MVLNYESIIIKALSAESAKQKHKSSSPLSLDPHLKRSSLGYNWKPMSREDESLQKFLNRTEGHPSIPSLPPMKHSNLTDSQNVHLRPQTDRTPTRKNTFESMQRIRHA